MKIGKLVASTLIAVLTLSGIAAGSLMLPADAAYAQGAGGPSAVITRTPLAPLRKDAAEAALSNYFKREQNWLNLQARHLERAGQLATKAQELIDAAKEEGKDVSALQAALDQFNSLLAQAQTAHDAAAAIIAAHAGFDEDGSVTDRESAHQTVVDARLNLRTAHAYLVQAATTLRQAIRAWRASH